MPPTEAGRFDPARAGQLSARALSLVERRRRLLGPGYRLFYDEPLEIVAAEGVHVVDRDGRRYLDAYNNVPVVGHCNPRVVAAVSRQMATLNTNTRYLDTALIDYAERLLATHGEGLERVMFTCSGSEAIDLGLRIARHATGREGVIVTSGAYHGTTRAAAEISPDLAPEFGLPPQVRTIRGPRPFEGPGMGERLAAEVAAAGADLAAAGFGLAAFVVDTAFVSDGLVTEPAGFLAPAVEAVHAAGGYFLADEVQAGFGRSGEAMWGYQLHGLAPDLVALGKPMANGLPIAAVAGRAEGIDGFGDAVRYFNTFAANSVSIAAAAAVLDAIAEEGLIANALRVGERIRAGLRRIEAADPRLAGVRGVGLMIAADLVDPGTREPDPAAAARAVNDLRAHGVLIGAVGPQGATLKIRPPLPISGEDADTLVDGLARVLGSPPG